MRMEGRKVEEGKQVMGSARKQRSRRVAWFDVNVIWSGLVWSGFDPRRLGLLL